MVIVYKYSAGAGKIEGHIEISLLLKKTILTYQLANFMNLFLPSTSVILFHNEN